MSITNESPAFSFLVKCIKEWADIHRSNQIRQKEDYCFLIKLGSDNDCLDFMAFTLIKGMEKIEQILGPF